MTETIALSPSTGIGLGDIIGFSDIPTTTSRGVGVMDAPAFKPPTYTSYYISPNYQVSNSLADDLEHAVANSTGDGGIRLYRVFTNLCVVNWTGRALFFEMRLSPYLRAIAKPVSNAPARQVAPRALEAVALLLPIEQSAPHQEAIKWMKGATSLPWERIAELVGVSRQTLYSWQQGKPITDANRRHILAVREVLERAATQYPTPEQLAAWLDTPRGVNGRTPAQLLGAGELDKARFLAISKPPSKVLPPPAWVKRPVPIAFRDSLEQREEALPPERDHELFLEFGEPGSEEE